MNLFSSLIFIVLSNNILVSEVNSQELARLNRTLLTRRNTRRTGPLGANADNQIPRLDNRQGLPRDLHYLQPTRRRCIKNIRIPNGKRRLLDGGTVVRFRCEPGFLLFGSPSAACVRGQWSEPIPACIRWGCGRLAIPYGTVGRPLYGGAAIYFECNVGFQMNSTSNLLVCDGLSWNGTVPACRGAIPTPTTMEASTTEFTTTFTSEPDLDEGLMDNWPDFTEDNKLVDDWITFAVDIKRNTTSPPKPDWTVAIDLDKEDHDSRRETFTASVISLRTPQSVVTNQRHLTTQMSSTISTTLPISTSSNTKPILTSTTASISPTTTIATSEIIPSTISPTKSPMTSTASISTSTISITWTATRPARINNRAPYGWNIPAINITSNTSRGEVHWINFPPTQRSSRRTTAGLNHLRCLLLSNAESIRRCLDALAHPTPRPVLRPWISGYPIRWYNMTLPTPTPVNVSDSENGRVTLPISSATSSSSTSSTAVSMTMTSTAPSTTTTRITTKSTTTARTTTPSTTTTRTTTPSTTMTSTTTKSTTSARTTRPAITTTTATTSTTMNTRRPRTSTVKKVTPLITPTPTTTTSRTTRRIPATATPPSWFPFPSAAQPSERDKEGHDDSDNSISQFLPREKNKLRGKAENERREFIAPFKLDTHVPGIEPKATSHSAFTTVAVVLILLCLGTGAAFVAYRLWRRNMGIARPSRHDSDRRNLSTSLDMEEEFVYFSNRS